MDFDVIIPARFASSRLPGKALEDIAGKPLINWVVDAAVASGAARVIVATDDQRIADAVGGKVQTVMTRAGHPSGTDRIAEAVQQLGLPDERIIVNLQGDEPGMPPALIQQVALVLAAHHDAAMATVCHPISDPAEINDPHVVKVVFGDDGRALYFSRSPVPYQRADGELPASYRHIGLYAYRVAFLRRFVQWPVCALEAAERLEQLRALYYGADIMVAVTDEAPLPGIDTVEDLQRFRSMVESETTPTHG